MRVVFLGSGRFAVPSLEALLRAGHDIRAVVSQPDKPQGRGRGVGAPPVKPIALAHGLAVLQPERIRSGEAAAALREIGADLHAVVAYGQILPAAVLQIPSRGSVNVHASLLPRLRGAAPVQWAVVSGEAETGVTTMLLDEGLDTGPILMARSTAIGPEETAVELEQRLSQLGAELLVETLARLDAGGLTPQPQDSAAASYARLLRKDDGRVHWDEPAVTIERKVRGFRPWPGMTATWAGSGLRVLRASVAEAGDEPPGRIVGLDSRGVTVACGGSSRLLLIDVQPDSRRPMPAAAFAAGARLRAGQRFD